MMAFLASVFFATNATPAQLVAGCRELIPADITLSGRLILRNRKGIVQAEHDYTLERAAGCSKLLVDGAPLTPPEAAAASGTILGTDVTWSDLTLDYLWWDDFSFDTAREGETINGQTCAVLVLKNGPRAVRIWVDRKTGALLQAEELANGEPCRRLWGTRIKKFGDRWMANVLEVETLGSGHRTKITVEDLK